MAAAKAECRERTSGPSSEPKPSGKGTRKGVRRNRDISLSVRKGTGRSSNVSVWKPERELRRIERSGRNLIRPGTKAWPSGQGIDPRKVGAGGDTSPHYASAATHWRAPGTSRPESSSPNPTIKNFSVRFQGLSLVERCSQDTLSDIRSTLFHKLDLSLESVMVSILMSPSHFAALQYMGLYLRPGDRALPPSIGDRLQ